MRTPLRLLSLIAVSLLVIALAVGPAKPSVALATTTGTGSLSAAEYHSCALKNGQAYCWGWNDSGLGNGSDSISDLPVAVDTSGVLAGKSLTRVSSGSSSICALDSSAAAYCWGYNAC
jgi:alpha-tubulin suppressor-like RCC1 family protein